MPKSETPLTAERLLFLIHLAQRDGWRWSDKADSLSPVERELLNDLDQLIDSRCREAIDADRNWRES